MDREQFDTLARLVSTRQSRRAALTTVLGAALLRHDPAAVLAKRKRAGSVKAQAKTKAKAKSKPCYPSTNCTPGKGKNTSGCDFSNSTAFFQGDFRGSNLSNSNLTGAQMAQGDFRGANLSGGCFVGANLLDAKLGSSVNLGGAIFCHTLMPDGTIEDRDCGKGTRCCPTPPPICEGAECGPEDTCVTGANTTCGLFIGPCCPDFVCTPSLLPVLLQCEFRCSSDADCRVLDPDEQSYTCVPDPGNCPFIGKCCQQRLCNLDSDCLTPDGLPRKCCAGSINKFCHEASFS
jgi:hypothetical protein